MNILITICARGGSKGIPGKNIKLLNDIPLIAYTIKIAKQFAINKNCTIALSTDDLAIKKVASNYGLISDYKRPKKLSKEQKDKMLQPDDLGETIAFICQMPKHVCINELTISPTWHRRYIADLGIEEL